MKRCLFVLCCIGMLLLSSCSFIWPAVESEPESSAGEKVFIRPEYRSEYENKWAYKRLDDRLQEGYGAIYTAVKDSFDLDESVNIEDSQGGVSRTYTGLQIQLPQPLYDREEARLLYTAFTEDNPEFFFIGNTYSYKGYRERDVDYYDVFCLVYTMDAKDRRAAGEELEKRVSELLKGLPQGTGEFETELYLHDRLLEMVSYDQETAEDPDPVLKNPHAFSAYGALVQGKAVCEGYSRGMQLLLHRAGLHATLVSGTDENDVAHMWNLVTIDGRNYHLDGTWNDADDQIRHTYFNLTTEAIEKTHKVDTENIGVDTCTATEADYFRKTGGYLDTFSRDQIAEFVAGQIRLGKEVIEMQFPRECFASAESFVKTPNSFVPRVNKQLQDTSFKMGNYSYQERWDYYTITVLPEMS